MDCFYINLDSATDRKSKFESNFALFKKPHWNLSRFSAIDTAFVKNSDIKGASKPAEKGCLLSHKILIGEHLAHDRTIFLLEDDAVFGARTCTLIEAVLKQNQNLDWDILFTDVTVPNLVSMIELLKYRRELAAKKIEIGVLDLQKVPFAGTTGYLVNGTSKRKLYDLIDSLPELNIPYDLYLRHWVRSSALKGFSLFPFVTSLSEFAETSQIKAVGENHDDFSWNMFRKMIWAERNLESCKGSLETIKRTLSDKDIGPFKSLLSSSDRELNAFGILFSSMTSGVA